MDDFTIEPFDKAKHDRAAAFYGKYGFAALLDDPHHMYLPMIAIEEVVRQR